MAVALLLLAAGLSSRMGGGNKLLDDLDGAPLLRRSAMIYRHISFAEKWIVTGNAHERLIEAVEGLDYRPVRNPDPGRGLGRSLALGAAAVGNECDAIMVALADMPFIEATTLDHLHDTRRATGADIVAPCYRDRRGHPVIFDKRLKDRLCRLTGDTGAAHLFADPALKVERLALDDPGILRDIDDRESLNRARQDWRATRRAERQDGRASPQARQNPT